MIIHKTAFRVVYIHVSLQPASHSNAGPGSNACRYQSRSCSRLQIRIWKVFCNNKTPSHIGIYLLVICLTKSKVHRRNGTKRRSVDLHMIAIRGKGWMGTEQQATMIFGYYFCVVFKVVLCCLVFFVHITNINGSVFRYFD